MVLRAHHLANTPKFEHVRKLQELMTPFDVLSAASFEAPKVIKRAADGTPLRYAFDPGEARDDSGKWTGAGAHAAVDDAKKDESSKPKWDDAAKRRKEAVDAKNSIPRLAKALGATAGKVAWGAAKIAGRLGVTTAKVLKDLAFDAFELDSGGRQERSILRMWDAVVGSGEWSDKNEESSLSKVRCW